MTRMMLILLAAASCAAIAIGCGDEKPVAPLPPSAPQGLPSVLIDKPKLTPGDQQYGKAVRFEWEAGEGAEPVAIRHFWTANVDSNGRYLPSFDVIKDLNNHPSRYEAKWVRWIPLEAPGDSGRSTIIGDDESLKAGMYYIFAVQAKDASGRITQRFDGKTNARRFKIASVADPFLLVYEPRLGGVRFIGTYGSPEPRDVPPGIPLHFTWSADASYYRGEIAGFRFGWDVPDVNAWDAPFEPALTEAPEVTFYAGVHTLFVETVDIGGVRSLGRVTVNVVPFPMDRALLFVDDYFFSYDQFPDYREPAKPDHDAFWLDLCSRATGFDPARDAYDCFLSGFQPPGLDLMSRYKNIIWTYSASSNAWNAMVLFTPESKVGTTTSFSINYLSMFLMRGGHVWTLGEALSSGGGLSATLPPEAQSFPVNLRCEIAGNRADCSGDRSGVNSMPYRDYCVTMLDKVDGSFRLSSGMPRRIRDRYDCMRYAWRDDADRLTAAQPGFPKRLDLWEEVTKPGRYFDPNDSLGPGGFTYVEAYDPGYWMDHDGIFSQACFHPLYRMKAASDSSALDGCTVALWVTKYENVVPDVASGIALGAPSFHFGFPLWFFKRSSVDSIVNVVFDEWGIGKLDR